MFAFSTLQTRMHETPGFRRLLLKRHGITRAGLVKKRRQRGRMWSVMTHCVEEEDEAVVASLALLLCAGVGNAAVLRAQAAAGRLDMPLAAMLDMPARGLVEALPPGWSPVVEIIAHYDRKQRTRARDLVNRVRRLGGRFLTPGQVGYPESLASSLGAAAPAVLTLLGGEGLLHQEGAAVVGARIVSQYGAALAAACAAAFCKAGAVVVSGAAQGVDTAAHQAALDAGGVTVAVLPQGLLTYAPPQAFGTALRAGRAALVSQFVPDAPWETHAAVTRNATISALARLICVIEPKKTGGSICTARHALRQGKRLLVHWGAADVQGPAAALAHAGALPVHDPAGRFSPDRLIALWKTAPSSPEGQSEFCLPEA